MGSSTRASGGNDRDGTGRATSRRAGWKKVPLFVWVSTAFMIVVVVAAAAFAFWFYNRSAVLKAESADRKLLAAKQSLSSGNVPLAQSDLKKLIDKKGMPTTVVPTPGMPTAKREEDA